MLGCGRGRDKSVGSTVPFPSQFPVYEQNVSIGYRDGEARSSQTMAPPPSHMAEIGKNVQDWTPSEVHIWIDFLFREEGASYGLQFEKNSISGRYLKMLNEVQLGELVPSVGHRCKIMEALQDISSAKNACLPNADKNAEMVQIRSAFDALHRDVMNIRQEMTTLSHPRPPQAESFLASSTDNYRNGCAQLNMKQGMGPTVGVTPTDRTSQSSRPKSVEQGSMAGKNTTRALPSKAGQNVGVHIVGNTFTSTVSAVSASAQIDTQRHPSAAAPASAATLTASMPVAVYVTDSTSAFSGPPTKASAASATKVRPGRRRGGTGGPANQPENSLEDQSPAASYSSSHAAHRSENSAEFAGALGSTDTQGSQVTSTLQAQNLQPNEAPAVAALATRTAAAPEQQSKEKRKKQWKKSALGGSGSTHTVTADEAVALAAAMPTAGDVAHPIACDDTAAAQNAAKENEETQGGPKKVRGRKQPQAMATVTSATPHAGPRAMESGGTAGASRVTRTAEEKLVAEATAGAEQTFHPPQDALNQPSTIQISGADARDEARPVSKRGRQGGRRGPNLNGSYGGAEALPSVAAPILSESAVACPGQAAGEADAGQAADAQATDGQNGQDEGAPADESAIQTAKPLLQRAKHRHRQQGNRARQPPPAGEAASAVQEEDHVPASTVSDISSPPVPDAADTVMAAAGAEPVPPAGGRQGASGRRRGYWQNRNSRARAPQRGVGEGSAGAAGAGNGADAEPLDTDQPGDGSISREAASAEVHADETAAASAAAEAPPPAAMESVAAVAGGNKESKRRVKHRKKNNKGSGGGGGGGGDVATAGRQPAQAAAAAQVPLGAEEAQSLLAASSAQAAAATSFKDLLDDDAHDCYYSVDTSMIVSYQNGKVPGWVVYVDRMSAKGKRFFVTNSAYMEYNKGKQISDYSLPPPFHRLDDTEASSRAHLAYPELMERLGLIPSDKRFATDVQWVLESGYCIATCIDIPEAAIVAPGKTFAVAANANIVQRLLNSPGKREIFETVIGRYGLEHLIDVRAVNQTSGTFKDTYAF